MVVTWDGLATSTIVSDERLRRWLKKWAVIVWIAFVTSSNSDRHGLALASLSEGDISFNLQQSKAASEPTDKDTRTP